MLVLVSIPQHKVSVGDLEGSAGFSPLEQEPSLEGEGFAHNRDPAKILHYLKDTKRWGIKWYIHIMGNAGFIP